MPRITRILGLRRSELPDFSTLCLRKQLLKIPVWRDFLRLSINLYKLGDIQAIDASGMDRTGASQLYPSRTKYTFKAVKTTVLIDCKTGTMLDIHCLMKQPHDSQVGWQLLTRNLDRRDILTADKGEMCLQRLTSNLRSTHSASGTDRDSALERGSGSSSNWSYGVRSETWNWRLKTQKR